MSFELMNAPTAFMDFINQVFCLFLDWSVIMFIDDILVYSRNKVGHDIHMSWMI